MAAKIGKIQSGDIYQVFREEDTPVLSTSEINDQIEFASRSSVYRKLVEMEDEGDLLTKKAGSGNTTGRVWYPPEKLPEIPEPTPRIKRLIYRNPGLSVLMLGFGVVGVAFLFFIPGQLGQGDYLGILNRDWLLFASLITSTIGLIMIYGGGAVMIISLIRHYRSP